MSIEVVKFISSEGGYHCNKPGDKDGEYVPVLGYETTDRAMQWWRTRCRETQGLLNEAVKVSRAQAANFTSMKRRAEAAEAKLKAAEEALRQCQRLFQNIHDYGAMGHPNDWLKVQAVWDMVDAALSTAPTPQPKVRIA